MELIFALVVMAMPLVFTAVIWMAVISAVRGPKIIPADELVCWCGECDQCEWGTADMMGRAQDYEGRMWTPTAEDMARRVRGRVKQNA